MNKKISVNLALAIAIIAMTVTFSVTMILSQKMFDKTVASVREKEITYNKIAEIDKTVRADYYGEINDEVLYDMIGAGYMQGIGDTGAKYYTAKKYVEYLNEQAGKVMGVGVDVIKDSNGYARVIKVYDNSPAFDAGIAKNSYITKIGDIDVKNLTLDQINTLMRGEQGTTVALTTINALAEEQPPISLQRRQYDTPSVEAMVPQGKTTGYVKISTFNSNTAKELKAAIETMRTESNITALVLDVRNNNGGSLDAAYDVIDLLCPAGAIANTWQVQGGEVKLLETSDMNQVDLPMVVLVNNNTAAGAELLATSIRDFEKGKIVGTTTAGKGRIQCAPKRLTDGSAVSYTIGMLLTRKEKSFDGKGIVPDIEATLKAEDEKNFYDLTPESDTQIQKCFEVADSLLNKKVAQESSSVSGSTASSGEASSAQSESTPAA